MKGAGHFIALKFSDVAENITSVKVGIDPTEGTGLVELDSDMNAVFKVKNKSQVIVVEVSDGYSAKRYTWSLSGLTLAN